jgi:hypothetical protein
MSFYIVFNDFSSFLEIREPVDSTEDIKEAVTNLVEKAGQVFLRTVTSLFWQNLKQTLDII